MSKKAWAMALIIGGIAGTIMPFIPGIAMIIMRIALWRSKK